MKVSAFQSKQIKALLREAGISYGDIAKDCHRTWRMVKYAVDGDRTSAPVLRAIARRTAHLLPNHPSLQRLFAKLDGLTEVPHEPHESETLP